jgi:uncharacterized membrane protein YfcA
MAGVAILALAILVVFTSGAVVGAMGFGFNMVSAPLLVLLYPPRLVVPVALVLGSFSSGLLLTRREIRSEVDWKLVRALILPALVGLPVGAGLLLRLDANVLRALIAGLTSLFALVMLGRYRPRFRRSGIANLVVGVLSGVLSTSTSLNGPILAFYLLGCRFTKEEFRANMIAFIFLASLSSVAVLAMNGSLARPAAGLGLMLLPGLAAGLWGGLNLAARLSQRGFDTAVLGFLAMVGVIGILSSVR